MSKLRVQPDSSFVGKPCACCGSISEGFYGIHRDGFCEGPEVPLCNGCGSEELPDTQSIWKIIDNKRKKR